MSIYLFDFHLEEMNYFLEFVNLQPLFYLSFLNMYLQVELVINNQRFSKTFAQKFQYIIPFSFYFGGISQSAESQFVRQNFKGTVSEVFSAIYYYYCCRYQDNFDSAL